MKTIEKRHITIIMTVCLILCCFTGCGFLGFSSSLLGSNIMGGAPGDTSSGLGGNAADTLPDDLTESEVELYADGPVDLPVTMAKLDSPDPNLIDITTTEISSTQSVSAYLVNDEDDDCDANNDCSDSLEDTDNDETDGDDVSDDIRFAVSSSPLYEIADGTPVRFDIDFLPGASPDPTDSTPKMYIYNSRSQQQAIVSMESDGSGEASIEGQMGDTLYISTMNNQENRVSPFFGFKPSGTGVNKIIESNSPSVSAETRVFSDASSNVYFASIKAGSNPASYYLWKRPANGGQVELVGRNITDVPRYVDTRDGNVISLLTQSGELFFFIRDGFQVTIGDTTITGQVPENTDGDLQISYQMMHLGNTGDGQLDAFGDPLGRHILQLDNVRGMLVNIPPNNMEGNPNGYLVQFRPLDGDEGVVDLVTPENHDFAWVAKGGVDTYFIAHRERNSDTFDLSSFDLSQISSNSDVVDAWNNRQRILSDFVEDITYITASRNNKVAFASMSIDFELSYWFWDGEELVRLINLIDANVNYGERFAITPDGLSIIACDFGENGDERKLVIHKIGVYPEGKFIHITKAAGHYECFNDETSFYVDERMVLHFVSEDTTTANKQKVRVDLHKFDEWVATQNFETLD